MPYYLAGDYGETMEIVCKGCEFSFPGQIMYYNAYKGEVMLNPDRKEPGKCLCG
jgi:hypothetical protein